LWSTRNWQARQKDHAEVWRAKQNVADLAKPLQTAIATRIRMSKVVGAAKSRLLYAGKSGAGGKKRTSSSHQKDQKSRQLQGISVSMYSIHVSVSVRLGPVFDFGIAAKTVISHFNNGQLKV